MKKKVRSSQKAPPRTGRRILSVTIMGKKFKIIEKALMEDREAHGETNMDARVIYLDEKLSPENRKATLLHEYCHVILGLSGMSEILGFDKEEGIVRALEAGLEDLVELK